MSADKKVISKHLLVLAIIFAVFGLIYMLYAADAFVIDILNARWEGWFGIPFNKLSAWQAIPIYILVMFIPTFLFFGISIWLGNKYYFLNFASIHEINLKKLTDAKEALALGLTSVESIEREYKGKLQAFESLQTQLIELQSVKMIDTEDLRKKLNAIAQANQSSVWIQRFLGFAIGIVSSLLSSYIWERIS